MVRLPLPFGPAVLLILALPACSGGGTFAPSQHRESSGGQRTAATFTIHWTNAAAPASVRHKDAISPSAQSVSVIINGTLATIANRNGSPSQSISLQAPVGTDTFAFNVYDGPNAQGHLLGSATVSQLIVDGAANVVSASIQAVCSVTNVQYANDDPLVHTVYGQSGIAAQTLQSIVLLGQSPAMLIVGPEDVDGNVIIASTSGTVSAEVTGSATITPVDGAHIQLTPQSGFRSTTPDTLTVAAPTCPTTTVAVQQSPAIYVENTSQYTTIEDWYGDVVAGGTLASGDVLIGYDTHSQKMIAYNPGSGAVNAYSLGLSSHTLLYTITTGLQAAWSNYLGAVFGSKLTGASAPYTCYYYTFVNPSSPRNVLFGLDSAAPNCAVAASTFPGVMNGYFLYNGYVYSIPLSGSISILNNTTPVTSLDSLAADDRTDALFVFNSTTPYVYQYTEQVGGSYSGAFGFTSAPAVGAVDTDGDNLYAVLSNNTLAASSYNGTPLSGFGLGFGTGLAIVVLSTNER